MKMNWQYSVTKAGVGFSIVSISLFVCGAHTRKDAKSNNPAINDFTIQCPGESDKCDKTDVTVTNISKTKKSYDDLLIICKDKDNPNAPDTEPYYIWPFALDPGEIKCMNAVRHCIRTENKDKKPGEPSQKYVTLLQIDSDRNAIWMKPQDCPKMK